MSTKPSPRREERFYEQGYRALPDGSGLTGPTGTPLKLRPNRDNYLRGSVNLGGKRTDITVHRMVAYQKYGEALFEPGVHVRHKDGNSLNNHPDNLDIGSARDNSLDRKPEARKAHALLAAAKRRRFTDDEIRFIRSSPLPLNKLAEMLGGPKSTFSYIKSRKTYQTVPDLPEEKP